MDRVLANQINVMRDEVYRDAESKGLYNRYHERMPELAAKLAYRIEDECIEAIRAAECIGEEGMDELGFELADVILTTLSVCGKLGIDIGGYIESKRAINRQRNYEHKGE